MGSHLVQPSSSSLDKPGFHSGHNMHDSTQVNSSILQSATATSHILLSDFSSSHPSALLSRKETSEFERQNINIQVEYSESIETYTRQLEQQYVTENCL